MVDILSVKTKKMSRRTVARGVDTEKRGEGGGRLPRIVQKKVGLQTRSTFALL